MLAKNDESKICRKSWTIFFRKPFQVERVYLTDARQRKEMGEFQWLSNKV